MASGHVEPLLGGSNCGNHRCVSPFEAFSGPPCSFLPTPPSVSHPSVCPSCCPRQPSHLLTSPSSAMHIEDIALTTCSSAPVSSVAAPSHGCPLPTQLEQEPTVPTPTTRGQFGAPDCFCHDLFVMLILTMVLAVLAIAFVVSVNLLAHFASHSLPSWHS